MLHYAIYISLCLQQPGIIKMLLPCNIPGKVLLFFLNKQDKMRVNCMQNVMKNYILLRNVAYVLNIYILYIVSVKKHFLMLVHKDTHNDRDNMVINHIYTVCLWRGIHSERIMKIHVGDIHCNKWCLLERILIQMKLRKTLDNTLWW